MRDRLIYLAFKVEQEKKLRLFAIYLTFVSFSQLLLLLSIL